MKKMASMIAVAVCALAFPMLVNASPALAAPKSKVAECQIAAMGHAKMTARTMADCAFVSFVSIGHCPSAPNVAVIKVGKSTVAIRTGSRPLRLHKG
jgi:hypothetical protein